MEYLISTITILRARCLYNMEDTSSNTDFNA